MMTLQTDNQNIFLPKCSWSVYENIIKRIAEGDSPEASVDDINFLKSISILEPNSIDLTFTDFGSSFYNERFIRSDKEKANEILRKGLLKFSPSEAILQLLYGVKNSKKDNALSILKSRGFWCYTDESPLINLLSMMNTVGLIIYSKKFKTIKVVYNSSINKNEIPSSIFIDPNHPFGNKIWLKRILSDCEEHIYWLDKHFMVAALEYIWEVADANKIKEVKILSLGLDAHVNGKTLKEYNDLKKELGIKGISLVWYKIDSNLIRDSHDRWIMGSKTSWNLPDVNTIMSGSRSDINKSGSLKEMEKVFINYLKFAKEIS